MLLDGIALTTRLNHRFRICQRCIMLLEFQTVIVESDWLTLNSAYISSTTHAMLQATASKLQQLVAQDSCLNAADIELLLVV